MSFNLVDLQSPVEPFSVAPKKFQFWDLEDFFWVERQNEGILILTVWYDFGSLTKRRKKGSERSKRNKLFYTKKEKWMMDSTSVEVRKKNHEQPELFANARRCLRSLLRKFHKKLSRGVTEG